MPYHGQRQASRPGNDHELPVALEVVIEREHFSDTKLFHNHEAERITEGIPLVGMAPEQVNGSRFIEQPDALDFAEPALDGIQEAQRDLTTVVRANADQGIRFPIPQRSS